MNDKLYGYLKLSIYGLIALTLIVISTQLADLIDVLQAIATLQ